jgi:OmpA-OmpF porin, OOP family
MNSPTHRLRAATVAALTVSAALAAHAQQRGSGMSVLPYTQQGYVGLNLGAADYSTRCGGSAYSCDNPDVALHLYTGGMFNEWLGVELGYVNTGSADRAGGRAKAQGANISLLARVPVGPLQLFAKGGTTYGRTRVSADALSGVPTGKASGWGGSFGAGVGYDFGTHSTVVAEWNRTEYRFAGVGRKPVETTSIGYVWRF